MHIIKIGSGELLDRLIIAEIKQNKMNQGINYIFEEQLSIYKKNFKRLLDKNSFIEHRKEQLTCINTKLWDLEDVVRENYLKDRLKVYKMITILNNIRFILKRKIDLLCDNHPSEVKSFDIYPLSQEIISVWLRIELERISGRKFINLNSLNVIDSYNIDSIEFVELTMFIEEDLDVLIPSFGIEKIVSLSFENLVNLIYSWSINTPLENGKSIYNK